MKKLIIRWSHYVTETITNEETGEEESKGHTEYYHEVYDLDNILKLETSWGHVKVYLVDGTITETNDDAAEIYFR